MTSRPSPTSASTIATPSARCSCPQAQPLRSGVLPSNQATRWSARSAVGHFLLPPRPQPKRRAGREHHIGRFAEAPRQRIRLGPRAPSQAPTRAHKTSRAAAAAPCRPCLSRPSDLPPAGPGACPGSVDCQSSGSCRRFRGLLKLRTVFAAVTLPRRPMYSTEMFCSLVAAVRSWAGGSITTGRASCDRPRSPARR